MNSNQNYYYPQTIRMITNAVIGMFSSIYIFKFDKQGNKVKKVTVPVIFGPQTKMARARTDEEVHSYYPEIPRINVTPQGMSFASDRVISPNTRRFFNSEDITFKDVDDKDEIIREINGLFSDFSPLPYDFPYEIDITCSTLSELSQILENTLPYFGPKNTTMRVKEFDFLNLERDLRVELGGVSIELSNEISQEETRTVSANFDLTVYGYIYRPIESTKIVNSIITKITQYNPDIYNVGSELGAVDTGLLESINPVCDPNYDPTDTTDPHYTPVLDQNSIFYDPNHIDCGGGQSDIGVSCGIPITDILGGI